MEVIIHDSLSMRIFISLFQTRSSLFSILPLKVSSVFKWDLVAKERHQGIVVRMSRAKVL